MTSARPLPAGAAAWTVIAAARRWQAAQPEVLVLAVDGHGAAGKSTIAAAVADATAAALVHTDDFFAAGVPGSHEMARYYDWRRIRAQALEPLRAGRAATFLKYDWDRGAGLDGTVTIGPSALIVLEGVFSAAPELADLVDFSVLVDTPEPERLRRLRARIKPADWDADWLIAEQAYFAGPRPPASFDLVVPGTSPVPADRPGGSP